MLLLFFLLIELTTSIPNIRVHLSELWKLKCDSLFHRSFYSDKCYFILLNQQEYKAGDAACAKAQNGAKMELKTPKQLWDSMFLESSEFHSGSQSSGLRKVVCSIDYGSRCENGLEFLANQKKCALRSTQKMSYEDAAEYCNAYDISLPSDDNDDQHRAIYGALQGESVWVRGRVSGNGWTSRSAPFPALHTCRSSTIGGVPANSLSLCSSSYAPIMLSDGKLGQGYLGIAETHNELSVLCLTEPSTDYFDATAAVKREKEKEAESGSSSSNARCKSCIEDHEYDPETNECEWTGPRTACLKLINEKNASFYYLIDGFPKADGDMQVIDLSKNSATSSTFNRRTVRTVVRRGCRATFWKEDYRTAKIETRLVDDVWYGEYQVPSYYNGRLPKIEDGLSFVKCICYPPMRNIQPTTSKSTSVCKTRKACVDQHEYDPETNECEWTGPPKACIKLFTANNDSWFHQQPGPPTPVDQYSESILTEIPSISAKFDDKVVRAVVRRGCRATFWAHNMSVSPRWRLVNDAWHGSYYIPSSFEGNLAVATDGLSRVGCVCYGNLRAKQPTNSNAAKATPILKLPDRIITTADPRTYNQLRGEHLSNEFYRFDPDQVGNKDGCTKWKSCVEDHEYNLASDQCEWVGPRTACIKLINEKNESWYHEIPGFPLEDGTKVEADLSKIMANVKFNEKTVRVVVRSGCRATFWAHPLDAKNGKDLKTTLLYDVWYGAYKMPSYQTGELSAFDDGLSRLKCICYPPMQNYKPKSPKPSPPKAENICASHKHCVDQHEFDPTTNQCEWTGPANACVKLYNYENQTIYHTIPGFPQNDGSKVEMNLETNYITVNTFNKRVTKVVVRRGCRATFYPDEKKTWTLLNDAWYGSYFMPSSSTGTLGQRQDGLTVIKCTCYPPLNNINQ